MQVLQHDQGQEAFRRFCIQAWAHKQHCTCQTEDWWDYGEASNLAAEPVEAS